MHQCSTCLKKLDAHSEVGEQQRTPDPGDISICVYCGEINVFDENLKLRKITQDEMDHLEKDVPQTYWLIKNAVRHIKQRIAQN